MNILENGTVLEMPKLEVIEYWKITGTHGGRSQDWTSYSVIRCSKTGKEFRFPDKNGFNVQWVYTGIKTGIIRIVTQSDVGTKANIDQGIVDGVRKRRIEYLRKSIEEMQSELERLEA